MHAYAISERAQCVSFRVYRELVPFIDENPYRESLLLDSILPSPLSRQN